MITPKFMPLSGLDAGTVWRMGRLNDFILRVRQQGPCFAAYEAKGFVKCREPVASRDIVCLRAQARRLGIFDDETVQDALRQVVELTDQLEKLSNEERQGSRQGPWWAVRDAQVIFGQTGHRLQDNVANQPAP